MKRVAALFLGAMGLLAAEPAAAQAPHYSGTILSGTGISYLVVDIAQEKKYFEEQGLDLKFITMNSASEMAAAVIGGSGDFTVPMQAVLKAQVKGQDLVAVAATMNQNIHIVVVTDKALEKAGVKKDDPLDKRIRSLVGLRIGITSPGSGTDIYIRMLFKRMGLNVDHDATLISLGDGASMVAAMETGQIDAYINGSPWPEIEMARGVATPVVNFPAGDIKEVSGFPLMTWFTTRKNIEQNPGKVQAFVSALYKAELFIRANPEETIEIAKKIFSDIDPKVIEFAVKNNLPAVPTSPLISREQLQISFDTLETPEKEREMLPFDKVIDNKFAYKAIETIYLPRK